MTPENAKYTKIVVVSVIGIGILYAVFGKSENGGNTDDPTGNNGNNLPAFNVKEATAKLYELMRYSGSTESKIVNFFRTITQAQFSAIYKEFGQRQYNKTLGNQQNPTAWFDQLPFEPLDIWLEEELSDTEFDNLARKYKELY